ncbi:accessory factor UbiK family protein [Roseomonas sp. GC11]|uniref:accessory factor UbiK family protein n=1 Tax=Roseomonas sp. GC11 TaxID=2950546 RepID=UPI00210CBFC5|nr:accessory factor UbiK family protein [Roseomonas sp. GC11]MCQ4160700.1 accessory factor UbiK family protein [Roseomonas sp. GC11]
MSFGSEGGSGRRGRIFDDLAGMAGGAFSVMAGLRAEVESLAKSQVEIMAQRLELVRREDLDAALEVARRAREESAALAARVAALEAKLAPAAEPPAAEAPESEGEEAHPAKPV